MLIAMTLLSMLLVGVNLASMPDAAAGPPVPSVAILPADTLGPSAMATPVAMLAPRKTAASITPADVEQLLKTDPWRFAQYARRHCEERVHDYTCIFEKRERIGGKLRELEEIEVRYRREPTAVFMIWQRNADQAKRVLYKDAPEYVDKHGEKVAKVEPAGALIRLVVSEIFMPIHGDRAKKSSRRAIDDFGFLNTFRLLDRYNQLGSEAGVLSIFYDGEGVVDGRPTYKIVRHLPYEHEGGLWPDARMVMHIDQEWLLPTAVYSYADHAGTILLGSYVHTNVKLNPGLTDAAFEF